MNSVQKFQVDVFQKTDPQGVSHHLKKCALQGGWAYGILACQRDVPRLSHSLGQAPSLRNTQWACQMPHLAGGAVAMNLS